MDEKTQEKTKSETAEGEKTQTPVSGTDDPKNRDTSKRKAEIEEREDLAKREEALIAKESELAAHKVIASEVDRGQIPVKPETDEDFVEKVKQGEAKLF